jgi:hypothetical protein
MRHRRRLLVSSCAVSIALLVAGPARSSPVPPAQASAAQKKEAMAHFVAGKRAISAKSYDEAIAELRASLQIVDSPNARLELARALRDAGKAADAWTEYERVVEDATRMAATEPRYAQTADAAAAERRDLESKLAFVEVTPEHVPAGATLRVGGRTIPPEQWAAPIVAPPGAVDVVLVDASGKQLARATVAASTGKKTPVTLDAQPPPPAPAPAAVEPAPPDAAAAPASASASAPASAAAADTAASPAGDVGPEAPSGRSKLRTYAYIAGGVGIAGVASFAIFGLMSDATYNDLTSACPPPNHQCPADKQGEISAGRTQQTIANVSAAVGVVGVAVGATLFVLSLSHKSDAASSALVVGPSFVGVRGSL